VVAVCRGSIACPVAAVKEWLAAANIVEGPVFRQVGKGGRLLPGQLPPQNVALIVKAYAKRLGLDPNAFSGHSLRAGLPHLRGRPGASLFKMMDVSRHKSVDTLRGYVRDADAFRDTLLRSPVHVNKIKLLAEALISLDQPWSKSQRYDKFL
jgi:hypothetical protein